MSKTVTFNSTFSQGHIHPSSAFSPPQLQPKHRLLANSILWQPAHSHAIPRFFSFPCIYSAAFSSTIQHIKQERRFSFSFSSFLQQSKVHYTPMRVVCFTYALSYRTFSGLWIEHTATMFSLLISLSSFLLLIMRWCCG